jgi:hypothetical protein
MLIIQIAGNKMAIFYFSERRSFVKGFAYFSFLWTSGLEDAPGRQIDGTGDVSFQEDPLFLDMRIGLGDGREQGERIRVPGGGKEG